MINKFCIIVCLGVILLICKGESSKTTSPNATHPCSNNENCDKHNQNIFIYITILTDNPRTPICGPNEVNDDCINGGCGRRNCSQLGSPQICIDPAAEYCIKGCRCKDNYLYDANGICVPITSCPVPKCKENEVFDLCPANCLPDCDVDQSLILCLPSPKLGDPECNPSCRCADNLYRTKDGGCVPKNQCHNPRTPICGPNEVNDDCINGGCGRRNCSQLGSPQICIDPAAEYCIKGCRCKDNYLYDANGICVPITSCPVPKCSENEVFDFCPANCLPDCDVDQSLILCLPSPNLGDPECNPSCRCADNLYRTKDGGCVPKNQCPTKCPNDEVYEECPDTCIPDTCQSIWARYIPCDSDTQVCKPSCRCPSGKYRNKIGQCITTEECLQCTKPNEYFSCGGECDNECDRLSRWNQTICPIVNIQCNKKCYCEEGYARDFNNDCIPIAECPPECPENERYVNNTNAECRAKTCAELGWSLDCFQEGYDSSGSPGCVCIDGYVRNYNGICVPIHECPSCGGDFNATSGCGTFCITCSNYQQKDEIACILSCNLNGCECRNDYVFDTSINKCILAGDCNAIGNSNVEYVDNAGVI